jgi:hypothetical protein
MILGGQKSAVGACGVLMLVLQGGGLEMVLVLSGKFRVVGPSHGATSAAIVTNAAEIVVDYRPVDVGVVDDGGVHVGYGGVVVVDAVAPLSSVEANARVTKAIVNSAVETDMRTPKSGVPEVDATAPAPETRCPE